MSKLAKKILIVSITFSVIIFPIQFDADKSLSVNKANAISANLIKDGSFEGDITQYWGLWQSENSTRNYEFYRSYDSPYGYGSYSAAINANGGPEDNFNAILDTKINSEFSVENGANYFLIFYAKSSKELEIITYLQDSSDYSAITSFNAKNITTSWNKYIINLTANKTGNALLAFVIGGMSADSSLYLDGIKVIKSDIVLNTVKIEGSINDRDKKLYIKNIGQFSINDIEIELPFNDNSSPANTVIINPKEMDDTSITFDMPKRTYSGIGKIYINSNYIDNFDYLVKPNITSFHPATIRIGEDLIVYGTGFMPKENNLLAMKKQDNLGNITDAWLAPEMVDEELTQLIFKLPTGLLSNKMFLQISFTNRSNNQTELKSNSLTYYIKPVIYSTAWSNRGYEQIGDKILIHGKGFGKNPLVLFYDNEGNVIDKKTAKVISINELETIETTTTFKANVFNIVVESNGVRSDQSDNLNYIAKPILSSINSRYSRKMYNNAEVIKAAKIGDTITLNGKGFYSNTDQIEVEFQGYNSRLTVPSNNFTNSRVEVNVPAGAQTGYVGIKANGVISNYLPLEIVPQIIEITPNPIEPGKDIKIIANGVGNNIELANIKFELMKNLVTYVKPYKINITGETAEIYAKAPLTMSNKYDKLTLYYDRWSSDGDNTLLVQPHITRAGINMDDKILTITGYGFSVNPQENKITYKYADENKTVINPKVKVLGVYPTDEGQEIRIKIYDNYHYGYVSVQTGDNISNEVQFGPISITKIARRIEFVESESREMGVLYISGYNFGDHGGVKVGDRWADIHYRSNFFIIAVLEVNELYGNPVIIARE
ncbi:MAG: hypothetical protein ABH830_01505 [Patescibacteria group bacterium]